MLIWEVLAIIGLLAAALFGAKSVRDFFAGRRMARSLKQLAHENESFKDNVDALVRENAELLELKAGLAAELHEFKQDLADLRGVCGLVGEVNAEALEKMRAIYARHRALLEAEVRASALRITLLLLEGGGGAAGEERGGGLEVGAVRRKLSALFPGAPLGERLTAEALADADALRAAVEALLRDSVIRPEAPAP